MAGDQHAPDARPANAPPPVQPPELVPLSKPETPFRDLLRFFYSSNPFYVISLSKAGLLRSSRHRSVEETPPIDKNRGS